MQVEVARCQPQQRYHAHPAQAGKRELRSMMARISVSWARGSGVAAGFIFSKYFVMHS